MQHEPDNLIELPFSSPRPVLALGAELKNTICVLEGNTASITASTGMLAEASAYRRFHRQVEEIRRRHGETSLVVAHDLHPASVATQCALKWHNKRIAVQHHHAHIVSCMLEHGVTTPVIGIACDGTGYGSDGAIWGGEILYTRTIGFERRAHLQYFSLPGGDAAARDTWRPALSLVRGAFGGDTSDHVRRLFGDIDPDRFATVEAMLRTEFNCPKTSSLGRLFDAVAFLAGYCQRNETEGQAAMRLEQAATGRRVEPYPFDLKTAGPDRLQITWVNMIRAICEDVARDESRELIADRFHETVAVMLSDAAAKAATREGVDTAVLSGGCFFNRVLTGRMQQLLPERGFRRVLTHTRLSPGDASLSLGQAVVAAETLRERPSSCV